MARRTQPPDFEAFGFDDDFDQILRGANPNPSREGCPTNEELIALSKRERPIGDPPGAPAPLFAVLLGGQGDAEGAGVEVAGRVK